MSEIIMIGKNAMTTTAEATALDAISEEVITGTEGMDINAEDATVTDIEGEGIYEDTVVDGAEGEVISDQVIGEGEITIPDFEDGYVDPGYTEGEIMYPGMETGMSEVKDPLLSSWPFVIGISAAVLVVSIALGALLAKLKIKKGIDLYED